MVLAGIQPAMLELTAANLCSVGAVAVVVVLVVVVVVVQVSSEGSSRSAVLVGGVAL